MTFGLAGYLRIQYEPPENENDPVYTFLLSFKKAILFVAVGLFPELTLILPPHCIVF